MAYTTNTVSNRKDMSATRPYLYSLGKNYGMSNSDVDKLIGWDNDTQQVSFGGKVIGTPDELSDGVSYWKDTTKLDNAFNDYISRSGTTRPTSTAVSQDNDDVSSYYKQTYKDLTETNPFETEVGKSILAKYDLSGLQARDNAVASGSASNGGNIDSYAAANALRQQASLVSQGQQVALDAHQQKIDNIRGLLSDMGVNIDRVFNQDQTAKNNEIARAEVESNIKGTVPVSLEIKDNIYLNEDGTIKDQYKDVDFYAVMQNAKATGNEAGYNQAAVARYYKIMNDYGLYGQYDDGNYLTPGQKQTEAGRQFDENQKTVQKTLETNSADNRYAVDAEKEINQANADAAKKQAEVDLYAPYDVFLSFWPKTETEKRTFVEEYLKPLYEKGTAIPHESLIQLILANTEKYNIDVDDAALICQVFKAPTDWLKDYRNRTNADGGVTWYDGTEHEGQYGGMIEK